jgi:outer membrane receptor for ferrienterochelin and colicins
MTSFTHRSARIRLLMRLLVAAPAIFGMIAAAAAGQQSAAQDAKPMQQAVQQVEIKGQAAAYDPRRDDTATKIVVSQEELLRNGDTTLGDALKRLPGITIGGVQGRGGEIRMRGLGSGYTQILLNGEPSPPGFSLDQVAPEMVERIEIMRAATAEYSAQAITGAINIVLKRQVHQAQRELKVGVQSDNGAAGVLSTFQLADKKGALSYAMGGNLIYGRQDRPSTRITRGTGADGSLALLRDADEQNKGRLAGFGLSPRVNWTLAPGEVLTSQTFVNVSDARGDAHERVQTLLGAAPPYVATDTDATTRFQIARTDLSWTRRVGEAGKLDAKFGINYAHRSSDTPQLQYYPGKVLALDRDIDAASTDKGVTGSGKYALPLGAGHAFALGWDGAYSLRDESRNEVDTSAVNAPLMNSADVFEAKVARIALFAQDEWNVTRQWSVYLGLRWEGIDTRSEGRGQTNPYAPIDNRSSVWSPLFQTLYKIPGSKNDQLRGAITRTYKAPNTSSLIPRRFIATNNSPTTPDSQGNPNLKPELAWGLDLGYEHYLDGGGMLGVSGFARRIQDVTRSRVGLVDGRWVSMPVNEGNAKTHGIELEAKFPLRSVVKGAPAVDVRANLTRTWSTLDQVPGPDNRLDQQTPVSGTLGFDWKLDKLPVTFGAAYSFQDGGPVRISVNQYAYAGVKRTLDLYGVWRFSPKLGVRAMLSNALHQDNVTASSYVNGDASTLSDTTITPTAAVVRAMLEMKF